MESILEPLIRSPGLVLYYRLLGDLLERERQQRERFYASVTEEQKAEFINGEVVVQSPVKMEHDFCSNSLNILLSTYVSLHDLGYVGHEKMLVSLTRNDYEPDVCFWNKEKAAAFQPGQTRFPAPDFVAEVLSPTTETVDRTIKFEDYAVHGVEEYWLIDPARRVIEQYGLSGNAYALIQKTDSGVLKSVAVSGFDILARAVFDRQEHLDTLRQILK